MNRREFLKGALILPLGFAFGKIAIASDEDLKSFGFYQGLMPNEKRDPRRKDGTYSGMPRIPREDIEAAVEKKYKFWHGHGGKSHMFVVTEENFLDLQDGKTIEVFTDVVTGHRHAVQIVG